jgi:hypothetical protein
MVAPIDSTAALARLAALMRQAAARATPSGKRVRKEAATTLRQQLSAIDADHPRRRRAMARVLVERLLTDEFGDAAANDAGFQLIVDDVLDAMERAPQVRADIDRVIEAILVDPQIS